MAWRRALSVAGVVLTCGFVVLGVWRATRPAHAAIEATPGSTAPAGAGTRARPRPRLAARVGGSGLVEPVARETRVAAVAPGRIAAIRVREGEFVAAGAALFELDTMLDRAALSSAEAELAVAEAEYTRVLRGLRREDVEATVAEAEAARARAALSDDVFARQRTLAASSSVPQADADRARWQAEADHSMARVSDARRRAAQAGARHEDIMIARARVSAAAARREQGRARLAQAVVRAPGDGVVLQLFYSVGEHYTPGTGEPLLILGDTRRLRVRMEVDEREASRVRVGAAATVTADGAAGESVPGRVAEVGLRMRRRASRGESAGAVGESSVLDVLIELAAPGALRPGQRVLAYVDAAEPPAR